MLILYGFLFLASSVFSTTAKNPAAQVSVTLYYETLCPFCGKFITNALTPVFLDSQYGPLFKELNLIPFGIVDIVNSTAHKYVCQHGEVECHGNRFHACAIQHIKDTKSLIKYISCLTKSVEADSEEEEDYPIGKCKDKVPDGIYPKIMGCYNSEEGWKLIEKYGRKTKKFFHNGDEFVPYVSFDNAKDDDMSLEAISDLKKVMRRLTGAELLASEESEETEEEDE